MKTFIKTFLIVGVISAIGFGIVQASTSDVFSGYAWSENIGWVSFNACYEGSCDDVDYGVSLNEVNGEMFGYAWSENIGWISFESDDLTGCPSGTCEAVMTSTTMSGWARALAYGDGWDGWISLRDDNIPYGVSRDGNDLEGYAWGDEVVGWLSFNCLDDDSCATSSYKVELYGGDDSPPNFILYSPIEGSWQVDDFNISYKDEDSGSGVDGDECYYRVVSFGDGGDSDTGWMDRDCAEDDYLELTIPVGTSTGDYCRDQGSNACYVYFRASDMAGNQGDYNYPFSIDWTIPEVGEIYIDYPGEPEPVNVTAGETYTLKSNVTDNIDVNSCGLYIDGTYQPDIVNLTSGCSTSCVASVDYEFTQEGTYNNNYIKCRDVAGNISEGDPNIFTTFAVDPAEDVFISEISGVPADCDGSSECEDQFSCCTNLTNQDNCCVLFSAVAYDPNDGDLTYNWDFDNDGSTDDTTSVSYVTHHYSGTGTKTLSLQVDSNATSSTSDTETFNVEIESPTLSVDMSAIPSFGTSPLNDVDFQDVVSGTAFGSITYRFGCTASSWNATTTQSTSTYTISDLCSYTATTTHTAQTEVWRGDSIATDTVNIYVQGSCVSGATTTCTSSHGCEYVITCQEDSTWPDCTTDDCSPGSTADCGDSGTKTCGSDCSWGTCVGGECTSDLDCYCSMDGCYNYYDNDDDGLSNDYVDYPIYGSCQDDYTCDTSSDLESDPCYPSSISEDSGSCNYPPVCNSLTAIPSVGVGPLDVILNADVVDDDGSVDYYRFTFGDSSGYSETSSSSKSHTYAAPGGSPGNSTSYTALVEAQDDYGQWSVTNATTSITVTENYPPVASLGCDASGCFPAASCSTSGTSIVYNGSGCVFDFINNSTDEDSTNPGNNDHISQSTWSISYQDEVITDYTDTYTGATTPIMANYTLPTTGMDAGSYKVILEVEDVKGGIATTSADFDVRNDINASFDCSLLDPDSTSTEWRSCDGLTVSEDTLVYFRDTSSGSETGSGTADLTSWSWAFTGGSPGSASNVTTTSVSFEQGSSAGQVSLTVEDDQERTDTASADLIITIPLPEWQEIAPVE